MSVHSVVTGNVGSVRLGKGGDTPVLNFSIASRHWNGKEEQTEWVEVALWGARATKLANLVAKGSRVAARGSMTLRTYEHNGEKRTQMTLKADDVDLLGKPNETPAPGPVKAAPASERDIDSLGF